MNNYFGKKCVSGKDLNKYLVRIGWLKEEPTIGRKKIKIRTDLGRDEGIIIEEREAKTIIYSICLYPKQTQEKIITNYINNGKATIGKKQ
jgi:hypothetical protein